MSYPIMAIMNQQQQQSNTDEDQLHNINMDLHSSSYSSGLHLDAKQQWLKSIEDGLRRKDSAMIGSIDVHKNMEKMQVSTHTIFRVPRQLRDVNPLAYDPLVVTLGPYKKSRKLQPTLTENFMAISAVKILLDMQGMAAEDFTALAVKINGAVDQLSLHYERIPVYDDETLMSIFTLDAAFVACFLVYLLSSQSPAGNATPARFSGAADCAAVILTGATTAELERRICNDLKIPKRLVSSIVRDLFLLENQIPLQLIKSAMEAAVNPNPNSHYQLPQSPDFTVNAVFPYCGSAVDDLLDRCIDSVIRCINPFQHDDDDDDIYESRSSPSPSPAVITRRFSFNEAAAHNLNPMYGSARRSLKLNGNVTRGRLHLLDSLYLAVTEPNRTVPAAETPRNVTMAVNVEAQMQLPSAVESAVHLRRAGIVFKPSPSNGKTVTSVRFDRRTSTLYLPKIKLGPDSEAVLRNLAAYEMVALQRAEVCSYLALMDDLIDTEEDVQVLRLSGVLAHSLRNDREVADLCNSIAKNLQVLYESDPFADAYSGIRMHLQKRMRYKRLWELYADFRSRYLSAPWLTASVLAATLLLMLTITQTYYAAAIYYKA